METEKSIFTQARMLNEQAANEKSDCLIIVTEGETGKIFGNGNSDKLLGCLLDGMNKDKKIERLVVSAALRHMQEKHPDVHAKMEMHTAVRGIPGKNNK